MRYRFIITTAIVALIAGAFGVSGVQAASPPPFEVTVVNPLTKPVPVTVVNSMSVTGPVQVTNATDTSLKVEAAPVKIDSAQNTVGVVNADPAVPLNVDAGAVKIDPTANTVQLSNSAAAPLYVSAVDSAGKEPFQHTFDMYIDAFEEVDQRWLVTPTGHWLVIEYVSVDARMGTTHQNAHAYLMTWGTGGGYSQRHSIPLDYQGEFKGDPPHTSDPRDLYAGSEAVRIYVPPETKVYAVAERGDPNMEASFFITISGYYTHTP